MRWGGVLDVKPVAVGHDIWELSLPAGTVRVRPGDRDYLSSYTLAHADPEACLARAQDAGLSVQGSSFQFAGVQVSLLPN